MKGVVLLKIMYVEIGISGHRIPYLNALTSNTENEVVAILPEKTKKVKCKQYICGFNNDNRTFSTHKRWIAEIYEVAKKIRSDYYNAPLRKYVEEYDLNRNYSLKDIIK